MKAWIENIESTVKEKMSTLEGSVHSFEHVKRVYEMATFLAKEEKADIELVQIGALLHDIGRAIGEPHGEIGAKLTNEILLELKYPQEIREKIVGIVLHHPLRLKDKLESLEERIIWDADKIDLMGMIGIARAFHWYGELNRSFEGAVKSCYEGLRQIHNLLNTPTAKKIAEGRHIEMKSFLSALEKELSVTIETAN